MQRLCEKLGFKLQPLSTDSMVRAELVL
jgi:hypothetical protein